MMDTRNITRSSEPGGYSSGATLSVMGICLDSDSTALLSQFVKSTPLVRLEGELHAYGGETDDRVLDRITQIAPDICLIDLDPDRRLAIQTAERIRERSEDVAIFAVSSNAQPDLIIQAMRSGCSEYLIKPLGQDPLLEAVARVGARKREKGEQTVAQIVTFIGAKGGTGVTTLAIHLSASLAKLCGRRTLLIDFHPDLGDVGLHLGLTKHEYHFYQLVESVDRLDAELLHGFVASHPSGVHALLAPQVFEPDHPVTPLAMGQTVELLRSGYDFIIVDCPPGLTEANREILQRSHQVYMVTVAEVSALRNTVRYLSYFSQRAYPREKIKIVLNRFSKRGTISEDQIERAIQRKIDWKIPNAYQEAIRAANSGNPMEQAQGSELARAVTAWASSLGTKPAADEKKAKRGKGLLSLLGS